MSKLPDVHFGTIDQNGTDKAPAIVDSDEDDDELVKTPKDVIELLGFDPAEFAKDR